MNNSVFLAHSGKQHSYHVAKALLDLGYLEKFCTSSYVRSKGLQKYLLDKGDAFWTRRFQYGLGGRYVESNWRFEIKELLYARIFGKGEKTQRAVYDRDIKFDRYLSSRVLKSKSAYFWGFQGSCHQSLKAAKNAGKHTICELATAHVEAAQRILGDEQRLHPEWADSFDNLKFPSNYEKRLREEPFEADTVLAASEFTRRSLLDAGIDNEKVYVLPLGCELDRIPFVNKRRKMGPLKVLFAGRITQRKGIKYLLEAVRRFNKNDVELHIIGYVHGSGKALKDYKSCFQLHPAVSQKELFSRYADYDVLALPSVFEGFGLVIVEAMAAGLPVIATPNTMGPDIIEQERNGYVVPVRDSEAIASAFENLLSKTADEYEEMRNSARRAAEDFSWPTYQKRLNTFLIDRLNV